MEELNICTLFIQTSLLPNHPTSVKVKNVHNFAIFKRICMKLCMESPTVKIYSLSEFTGLAIFWLQGSYGIGDLSPPSVADPDTVQIFKNHANLLAQIRPMSKLYRRMYHLFSARRLSTDGTHGNDMRIAILNIQNLKSGRKYTSVLRLVATI